jgi:hypothetical protein
VVIPRPAQNTFLTDLRFAEAETRSGIVASYAQSQDRSWQIWQQFCAELSQNPNLQDVTEPIALLQVYARRVRDGRSSASGQPVKSATVDRALLAVSQKITMLGAPDPRLDSNGNIDIRLRRQLAYYDKRDPAPNRALPIPIEIIKHASEMVNGDPSASHALRATADLATTAFYFLMRNGEYCHITDADGYHPFRFENVTFAIGNIILNSSTSTAALLMSATSVTIKFND